MSHVEGRLKADGDWIGLESDSDATVAYIDAFDDEEINEANARRLAACWNACESFTTEFLEDFPKTINTVLNFGTLKQDRDELRKAAEEVLKIWEGKGRTDMYGRVMENLRVALENK